MNEKKAKLQRKNNPKKEEDKHPNIPFKKIHKSRSKYNSRGELR